MIKTYTKEKILKLGITAIIEKLSQKEKYKKWIVK